jgi:hypothetical protein
MERCNNRTAKEYFDTVEIFGTNLTSEMDMRFGIWIVLKFFTPGALTTLANDLACHKLYLMKCRKIFPL